MISAKIVLTMSQSLTRLMTNRFIAKRELFARLLFVTGGERRVLF